MNNCTTQHLCCTDRNLCHLASNEHHSCCWCKSPGLCQCVPHKMGGRASSPILPRPLAKACGLKFGHHSVAPLQFSFRVALVWLTVLLCTAPVSGLEIGCKIDNVKVSDEVCAHAIRTALPGKSSTSQCAYYCHPADVAPVLPELSFRHCYCSWFFKLSLTRCH